MLRSIVRIAFFPLRYWVLIAGVLYTCILLGLLVSVRLYDEVSEYSFLVLGSGLVTFVLATFSIFQLTIARRVNHLIQVAERFAQADWTARVSLTGYDEFAVIGAAFNQMANQLTINHQRCLEAEAAISANQELLQGLLTTIDTVAWSATADGKHYHYMSPSIEQVYGRPITAFFDNPQLWVETIHPADRERVLMAEQTMQTTGIKQVEYRIVRPDGTIRWLHDHTRLVRDKAGQPLRLDGVAADITTQKTDRALLAERARFATLRAQLSLLLTQSDALSVILQQVAEALVEHLSAALVRVWTYNPATQELELQASAGLATHLNGPHGCIALSSSKIGYIVQQRQLLLIDNVLASPLISDPAWAKAAGLVAFAGYPLIVDDTVVGVVAAFVRHPLHHLLLEGLSFTAGGLARLIKSKQIEEALQASEERFRLAVEGARYGVWDWNVATGEIVANQSWAAMLGYKRQKTKISIQEWEQYIHPEDMSKIRAAFTAHSEGRLPYYECEHRVSTQSGAWKWVIDRGQIAARDVQGQALRVTGILEDITTRKQTELVLQNFFRLSLDFLCIVRADGCFTYVNPAFAQALGFTVDDLLATSFAAFVHPKDLVGTQEKLQQLVDKLDVIEFENRCRDKAGAYRWWSWRATGATDGLIYAVAHDITERKRLALLMAQTQTAARIGGWEMDWVTNQLYFTDETYRIYETTPEQYQPTLETMIQFYTPESIALITAAAERGVQEGQPWNLELEMITTHQRRVWVHMTGQIQFDQGQVVKIFGSLQDITARKQTEAALRQSEERNRAILDALPDTVFVTDKAGVLLDTLNREHGVYYVPIEQFLGKRVDEVLPPPVAQQIHATIAAAAKGERQVIEYALTQQDRVQYFEARFVPLDADKVLSIVRNITEQKQVKEERFIRKIAEAVPYMMYVYDLDEQRHVYVNHQVRQDLGYSPEEFLQIGPLFVDMVLHNVDTERFPELLSRWERAEDGEVLETEYQMKHKQGEWRWFAGRDTVFLRHPDGRVHQIIGTAQDITVLKRTQQQILGALKEKEALLKEVHHRVKNNLQIISSLLNLQAAQIKDAAILSIFTETKNRVRSMALLHETLYRTENLARIDFQRYVDSLCAYLFRSYGVDTQRIGLQTAIVGVTLDLDQAIPCGLIINELISNAVKYAFPEQRRGMVHVELQQLTDQCYQLQVRDNGIGLPPDLDLAQTESLGLSLVYDLAHQLNGEIHVDCTAGTAVTIRFRQ